jgi:chemosensory pili system protein ChpC
MNAVVETVRSLWVPLAERKLLVPNVAVAEVINYQPLDLVQDGPEWLLGRLRWRDQELPVVSMEQLLGLHPSRSGRGARISIFNSVKPNSSLAFFATVTAGIPRLFTADADALGASLRSEREFPATVADCVEIAGEEALIPDLEAIQALVEQAWRNL